MTERSYVVGLPVSITVRDDGWVQAECDLSEAGQSIRKDWESLGVEPQPTEEQLIADSNLVDRWSDLNMLAHGEFAPDVNANKDLPSGYRWADADETERIAAGDLTDYIVVPRSTDSAGVPYTQGEADVAVPITDAGLEEDHRIIRKFNQGEGS